MTPAPVIVVGGYLGAGKTTLINRLLRNPPGVVWVLVNDFGEINIDASLIRNDNGETVELSNGCVCCAVQDDLADTILRAADAVPRPDLVIIETSGVADPSIAASYSHLPSVRHGGTVVVIDGERFADQSTDRLVGRTIRRQVSAADLLVVTKAQVSVRLAMALRSMNSFAPVIHTDSFDPTILSPVTSAATSGEPHENPHSGSVEHPVFDSPAGALAWLDGLDPTVVRVKGVVQVGDARMLVERVGHKASVSPTDAPVSDGVVVIRAGQA